MMISEKLQAEEGLKEGALLAELKSHCSMRSLSDFDYQDIK